MVETERAVRLRPYEVQLKKFNYQQVIKLLLACLSSSPPNPPAILNLSSPIFFLIPQPPSSPLYFFSIVSITFRLWTRL